MNSGQHLSPSRLVAAREFRGMTQRELAIGIGVTPMAVSAYEKGAYQPGRDVVQQMSFALRFPIGWFYAAEIHLLQDTTPTFRARRSMTAALRGQATRSCDIAVSVLAPALRQRFRTPSVSLPDLSCETPEAAAEILRDEWKLGRGPISNVVHLLESKGVMVFWTNIDDSSVDACSFWLENQPVVLLNSHKAAGDRSRFDASHELGHLVLHRVGIYEQSRAHRASGQLVLGSDRVDSPLDGRTAEKEADTFASSFLMPREQWKKESPKQVLLPAFFPLKVRWKVALSAMLRRSRDTGILSQDQYERGMKEMGYRGWRTKEPAEIAIVPETSLLQKKVFAAMQGKGMSSREFAASLNISEEILHQLMPVLRSSTVEHSEKPVLDFEKYAKQRSA